MKKIIITQHKVLALVSAAILLDSVLVFVTAILLRPIAIQFISTVNNPVYTYTEGFHKG